MMWDFGLGHVRNVTFGAPRLARFAWDCVYRRYLACPRIPYVFLRNAAGIYPLEFNGEQAPNPESRVLLARETDRYGVPRLKIDWRASELDWLTLSRMLRELRRAVERCGCGTIEYEEEQLDQDARASVLPMGGHHIGTARMSESPSSGVVNADGRVQSCGQSLSRRFRDISYFRASQPNANHRGDGAKVGATS
jgi:GMC oxidoreductase